MKPLPMEEKSRSQLIMGKKPLQNRIIPALIKAERPVGIVKMCSHCEKMDACLTTKTSSL